MLLADFIARNGFAWTAFDTADAIASARLIRADNVANYFYESNKDDWSAADFPSLVPPFKEQFIEWDVPREKTLGGKRVVQNELRGIFARAGVLIRAHENTTQEDRAEARRILDELAQDSRGPAFGEDPRWILSTHACCALRGHAVGYPWIEMIAVAGSGDICGAWFAMPQTTKPNPFFAPDAQPYDFRSEEILPGLLAVSLMNCKNVHATQVRPDAAMSKAAMRRHGHPLRSYHVLEIDPFKAAARKASGATSSVGARQALAICRGHFKDYRQSGLFGKVRGVFWWDAHARGDATVGTVMKDYAVSGPPVDSKR